MVDFGVAQGYGLDFDRARSGPLAVGLSRSISSSCAMPPEDDTWDAPVVTISDATGRTLDCYVEQTIEVEGKDYVLLHPVDMPVEIVTWEGEDDDDDDAVMVEDDEQIDRLFGTAKAVLAEENLTLKRSAIVLTVEGELPEIPEEEIESYAENGTAADDEEEEFQWLASFFHEKEEYAIYAPLDPFFILARVNEKGEAELLDEEELERIEALLPNLDDRFFSDLD